ncbi:hypothetical protein [Chondromyces apiculatus]|uniref:Peptidase C51 domain-containing protein n=1 Tax=Chondromyces apiculatus DSM 436 TaxID=1192034 RepID=A0A017T4G0_9BACT|nr:hypothetical protein [Chondromyces apiculatus]EYF04099.1 Hypothetical protein CAP_4782 [Chondromyces apiculatus DSM 436]
MTHLARCLSKICLSVALAGSFTFFAEEASAQPALFYDWAQDLVDNVGPSNNDYGTSPFFIKWAGIGGSMQYENRTLCSNFLTALLQHAYHLSPEDIRVWTGSTSPNALKYYQTIVAQRGFTRIQQLAELEPGDIIAIRYTTGTSASGHLSIVEDYPSWRASTSPMVSGTVQYEVAIMDSTERGHGEGDSRLQADGVTWNKGAGRGTMRFYADANSGVIVGHTWSLSPYSVFYNMSERTVAVGRLDENQM